MPLAPFFQKGVVQNVYVVWLIFVMIRHISWFLVSDHGSYGMHSVKCTLWRGCKPYFPSRYPYHQTKLCFLHYFSSHISHDSSVVLKLFAHSHAYVTEWMWHIGSMFMVDNQMVQFGNHICSTSDRNTKRFSERSPVVCSFYSNCWLVWFQISSRWRGRCHNAVVARSNRMQGSTIRYTSFGCRRNV